ncbi:MAG: ATP-binding protein [Chloroflexi bacterium]|nr:ATP-binding protein [Chloroflexota bacterium]
MIEKTLESDLVTLRRSLAVLPSPGARPVFLVVSGLPGTGKSYVSRRLAEQLPLVVLETDSLRRALFHEPTHSATESARLFRATHALIEELLKEGYTVLLDATNLVESHRERLYHIAHRLNVKQVLVSVEAPPEMVKERLASRVAGDGGREDRSTADWGVYTRMKPTAQPIQRPHYRVDTSQDVTPVIEKIRREVLRWTRATG